MINNLVDVNNLCEYILYAIAIRSFGYNIVFGDSLKLIARETKKASDLINRIPRNKEEFIMVDTNKLSMNIPRVITELPAISNFSKILQILAITLLDGRINFY